MCEPDIINDKNVKDITLPVRCIKKVIKFEGKNLELWLMTPSPAFAKLNKIIVTDRFFNEFIKMEQVALIYHEKYHQRLTTLLKRILLEFGGKKRAMWSEEFSADRYAVRKSSKKAVLSFLKRASVYYKKGIVEYNSKTHPPIQERIKRVDQYEDS